VRKGADGRTSTAAINKLSLYALVSGHEFTRAVTHVIYIDVDPEPL
jgi:hypothetical protein